MALKYPLNGQSDKKCSAISKSVYQPCKCVSEAYQVSI